MSVSAARFYADRGILVPAEVDSVSGYRRYDSTQIELGRLIRRCREMKMSLAQIEQLISEDSRGQRELAEHHVVTLEREVADVRGLLPSFDKGSSDGRTLVDAAAFCAALDHALTAAGRDPERPDMMAVRVELRDSSLRIAGTDRHRLAVCDIVPVSLGRSFAETVSAAGVRRWADALRVLSGTVELSARSAELNLIASGLDDAIPRVAINFPPYEAVLNPPTDPTGSATTDRDSLTTLLTDASGDTVDISATDGTLTVLSDGGPATIPGTTQGSIHGIVLDRFYALDAVAQALGDEVVVEARQATDPIGFRSANTGSAVTMVMPILS